MRILGYVMKCDDVKSFCGTSGIAYTLIKCGPSYLLAVPAAASPEVLNFLDVNGVPHSRPCSVITNYHDIYLTLDG